MNRDLIDYTLHLADTALILGHRNSEWCGHGPILEQDIAISNISLDLIGQARNFYQYAASLKNDGSTEDSFAYFRDASEFKNVLLVEQPNGDWAHTIVRQFLFSVYQHGLFEKLKESRDAQLAAIAEKAIKEITYHLKWSGEWVIRLGDGTNESHQRMINALDSLWRFTAEMFVPVSYENELTGQQVIPEMPTLRKSFLQKVSDILEEATLSFPRSSSIEVSGKLGQHGSHLETILKELQSVARAYPTATW